MGKMTTMQIGKDNCLQIPYLKDVSAWVSELDGRGAFHLRFLGSAQLSPWHLLVEAGSHCADNHNSGVQLCILPAEVVRATEN